MMRSVVITVLLLCTASCVLYVRDLYDFGTTVVKSELSNCFALRASAKD